MEVSFKIGRKVTGEYATLLELCKCLSACGKGCLSCIEFSRFADRTDLFSNHCTMKTSEPVQRVLMANMVFPKRTIVCKTINPTLMHAYIYRVD